MVKNIIIFVLLLFSALSIAAPLYAAADELSESIYSDLDEALNEGEAGISAEEAAGFGFSDTFTAVKERLEERIKSPVKMLAVLLSMIVFMAFIRTSGGNGQIYGMVCVLAVSAAVLPELFRVYEGAFSAVIRTGGFIEVFVPVFTGLTAAVGGLSAAGLYNMLILAASELIVGVTGSYFMPLVSVMTALSVSGSVFSEASIEKLAELMKKLTLTVITTGMTLFTGFVSMKCTIAAKADGAASKAVKLALSGSVPYVGGAVTDAFATVRGSFDIIRGSVGAVGTTGMIVIMLPFVIEIIAFRAVMWLGSAAADMLSVQPIAKLLNVLDSGLAAAQSILVCYSMMFVLCTGILLNCCGE